MGMDLIRRHLVWVALAAQTLLLTPRLDLLPLWDDERITLHTAGRPPAQIIRAVQVDVHPPLYYFLTGAWWQLPLPGNRLLRTRALSVLLALAATVLFHRLWLRHLPFERRALVLILWVTSPCLLLYARIARSYTLQLLLVVVAIRLAHDWLRDPGSRRFQIGYVAAATVLLYTHYLPGLAVVASTTALVLWRRQWRGLGLLGWIALGYLPWIVTLVHTAGLVAATSPYRVAGNWAVENVFKLGYAFVALQFGETIPLWAGVVALLLLPAIGAALWSAWRQGPHPPVLFLLLAAAGYFIAASWVSFAFVGARLLFLLPFYYLFLLRGVEIRRPLGALTYAGLLLVAAAGASSYYRKQDFLNKGYLVDFEAISRTVHQRTGSETAYVLVDRFSTSAGYSLHGPNLPYVRIVASDTARKEALDRIVHDRPPRVWYVHHTRYGTGHQDLVERLAPAYQVERHLFVPYSSWDRAVMRVVGQGDPPTHVIEALEFGRHPVSP